MDCSLSGVPTRLGATAKTEAQAEITRRSIIRAWSALRPPHHVRMARRGGGEAERQTSLSQGPDFADTEHLTDLGERVYRVLGNQPF